MYQRNLGRLLPFRGDFCCSLALSLVAGQTRAHFERSAFEDLYPSYLLETYLTADLFAEMDPVG